MKLFVPNISPLIPGARETYNLYGTIVVPSERFHITGMGFGVPPQDINIPRNFFPVQIHLGPNKEHPKGNGLQIQVPLDFRATATYALPVGGDTGYTYVTVFTLIDTVILGKSSVRVPEPIDDPSLEFAQPSPCQVWGWRAWRNLAAPKPQPIYVQGHFEADSLGYSGQLTPAKPQGFDPDELILRLDFEVLEGVHPIRHTRLPVAYTDAKPVHHYRSIQVIYPNEGACQFPILDVNRV